MSLEKYVAKRDFSKTAEPESRISADKAQLLLVVQKHNASHLHYDIRLESPDKRYLFYFVMCIILIGVF